ncbi:Uncharacterized conserved protein [uncultured Clostridium sp.]|uniref:YbgA family protein n=1 Tax=uncultured Clostridium sp. TaxID=59620 RepID=UPI000822A6A0|nr:DUF523 and DUF1722 domain-containing protein [uncultured Clostridium sp.]SCK03005.1 Uncharacterized conserved protein [uncultured Clostridium sp.]
MNYDVKPILVISKCLGFEACRYNGGIENNVFIENLRNYVDFITVCPETDLGLPIPRDTLRIVQKDDKLKLVVSKTGQDVTEKLDEFAEEFLKNLEDVDGFIFKNKSPTCGVKDAKIYTAIDKGAAIRRGKGVFVQKITNKYPNIIIEDEGRLTNFKIREHFLTRIFVLASFRDAKKNNNKEKLKNFHLKNTLLFLAYSQKYSKLLDSLIYNDDSFNSNMVFNEYEKYLYKLLERAPRYTSNINVLLKSLNNFKDDITQEEMQFIWNTIDKYKKGLVPFSVPLYLVKGYIIRFNLDYLSNQSFFMPYPEELIHVNDSGKLIH